MKINDALDVTMPVDHENIITFKSFQSPDIVLKGYQVAKHIWVVPEPYQGQTLDPAYVDGAVISDNYLSEQRQHFLHAIIVLLKRLNQSDSGKKLLSLVSTAIPYPEKAKEDNNWFMQQSIVDNDTFEHRVANIIIYFPKTNLAMNEIYEVNNVNSQIAAIGSMCEIVFNPFFTFKIGCYFMDPAMLLAELLIKALYRLYGVSLPPSHVVPYKLNFSNQSLRCLSLEDLLVFGGKDVGSLTQLPYWLEDKTLQVSRKAYIERVAKFETDILPDEQFDFPLKNHLAEKFKLDITELWFLSVSRIAQKMDILYPDHYRAGFNELQHDYYYTINYFENHYTPDGFFQGQIETVLPPLKASASLNINDIPAVRIKYKTDSTSFYEAILYPDQMIYEDDNFYENTIISYNTVNLSNIIGYTPELLNSVEAEYIAELVEVRNIYALYNYNYLYPEKEYPVTRTIIENVDAAHPKHYIKAALITEDNYQLTSTFENAASQSRYVYSFLPEFVAWHDAKPYQYVASEETYYQAIIDTINRYHLCLNRTEAPNQIKAFSFIVPWLGKAINILNDPEKSFEEMLIEKGIDSLLPVPVKFSYPTVIIDEIADDEIPLPFAEMEVKLKKIYLMNKVYFARIYNSILQQWQAKIVSQLFYLKELVREALLCHGDIIIRLLDDLLLQLYAESKIDINEYDRMKLESAQAKVNQLSPVTQKALNSVSQFFNEAATNLFLSSIYPKYLELCHDGVGYVKAQIEKYINHNGSQLTAEQKNELAKTYIFDDIYDIDYFDSELLDKLSDSTEQLSVGQYADKLVDLNFSLSAEQKLNISNDVLNNQVAVEYDNALTGIRGCKGIALKLEPGKSIKITYDKIYFSATQSFTLNFWLRLSEPITETTLISQQKGGVGWNVAIVNQNIKLTMIDVKQNQHVTCPDILLDKAWHNIVFSVDRLNKQVKFFYDGALVASHPISHSGSFGGLSDCIIETSSSVIFMYGPVIMLTIPTEEEVYRQYAENFPVTALKDKYGDALSYRTSYLLENFSYPDQPVIIQSTNQPDLAIRRKDDSFVEAVKFQLVDAEKKESEGFIQINDTVILQTEIDSVIYYFSFNASTSTARLVADVNQAEKFVLQRSPYSDKGIQLITQQNYYTKVTPFQGNDYNFISSVALTDESLTYLLTWNFEKTNV